MKWSTSSKEFENFLKFERNLSKNTISGYLSDLKKLKDYLVKAKLNIKPSEITTEIIRVFIYSESKR
jgi:integrase/recombinase XerD